jgi:probable F420-dependent oxidoreductase
MRIGVAFPTTEIGTDPAAIRDFAQAAEELGYDHITIIDHVLQAGKPAGDDWRAYYSRDNMFHEPFVTLGFLAAVTERIGLATAILILPQRPAVLVAKQAAELDVLCRGRLRLGVGLGWNELEFDALGQNFKNRGRRMVEQVALMRRLWTEELVTFEGEWHRIADSGINPLPVQRPIPVWVGAFAAPAIRRAAAVADGWFVNPRLDPDDTAARSIEIFREAAAAAGRDPAGLGLDATIHLGNRGSQEWGALVEGWKRLGVSHGTVRTMYSGFKTLDDHLEALRSFRAACAAGSVRPPSS